MWGTIIGSALSLGSSIFSGIESRNAQRRQEAELERQKKENEAWYDRRYNEDPTKRADTMRLLTQMQEQIKNRNRAARGRQAIMGGTEDSTTAVKEANNKTIADTISQIVAKNESRKDDIEKQYLNNRQNIEGKKWNLEESKAENAAKTASTVAATASNIASLLDGGSDKPGSASGSKA